MFKKKLLVISIVCTSVFIQGQVFAEDPSGQTYVESEYKLAKDVMEEINNNSEFYQNAMKEYEEAKDNYDMDSIYANIISDVKFSGNDSGRLFDPKIIAYRVVETKLLNKNKLQSRHEYENFKNDAFRIAAGSVTSDFTVNGRSLLNEDVEMNHNLVVHNGLEAGSGILSATQNAVEIKLRPSTSVDTPKTIPSNTHGIVASNDGYVAVGHSGNQIGFNSEKAEIISASGQSRVSVSHETATVQAAKEVHLSGGKTSVRINDEGVTLNNARIHGVAPGVAQNDAVNVGQLRSLRHHVNTVDKDLRAGIAMSMAAASIPQSYVPGKSLAALGAATYRGQSGFAVGVSTITDNGKWVFKVNGTGDTRGNFGAGIGAGYLF